VLHAGSKNVALVPHLKGMLNVLLKMMFNCCKKSYFCFNCCVQVPVGTIMLFNINMQQEVLPEVQQEVLPPFCGKCCQEYGKKCCQEGSKTCCQKGSKSAAKSAANMFALVAQRATKSDSHEGCKIVTYVLLRIHGTICCFTCLSRWTGSMVYRLV
jgi:hypothetical protein